MRSYRYVTNCCSVDEDEVDDLSEMIDNSLEISRRTFLRHIGRDELRKFESSLGYDRHYTQGLTMSSDWHVKYSRGRFRGQRAYYVTHSAIEYIFLPEEAADGEESGET